MIHSIDQGPPVNYHATFAMTNAGHLCQCHMFVCECHMFDHMAPCRTIHTVNDFAGR